MPSPVEFWNRAEGRIEKEKIYREGFMHWLYETRTGGLLEQSIFSRRWFSRIYGGIQNTPESRKNIPKFIRDHAIQMDEFENGPFKSFNEFFARRFRSGKRSFGADPGVLPAFTEGRYLAWERSDGERSFPVKSGRLSFSALLGGSQMDRSFRDGPIFISRLCPTDYHRFHFPDEGKVLRSYRIPGALHSVSPISLKRRKNVFLANERRVSLLETRHFGRLAFIEVGALGVGKIIQTHDESQAFERGAEKGFFHFGGSTVILIGEAGAWKPDRDLLDQTAQGRETFVKLGERIGGSIHG